MYPSILSIETINKLKLSFECGIPRPQDAGHLRFGLFFYFESQTQDRSPTSKSKQTTCYCKNVIQLYSAIAVLATCPRTQGYRKEPLFHTKRRSGRDQATCLAGSVSRRSAIHYASSYHRFQRINS
jgi:hypothetical protein